MEKKKGVWILPFLFLLLLGSSLSAAEQLTPPLPLAPAYDISVEEAHELLMENPEQIILLDVRTEGEYNDEYIPGAINIPLPELENRIDELDRSKTIIVYCKSGSRSSAAKSILTQHDFIVYNMLGGINAWKEKFATSTATPASTLSPTPLPAASPALTPAASAPVTAPAPTAAPERRIPGFKVISGITALSLIAWCLLNKRKGASSKHVEYEAT